MQIFTLERHLLIGPATSDIQAYQAGVPVTRLMHSLRKLVHVSMHFTTAMLLGYVPCQGIADWFADAECSLTCLCCVDKGDPKARPDLKQLAGAGRRGKYHPGQDQQNPTP